MIWRILKWKCKGVHYNHHLPCYTLDMKKMNPSKSRKVREATSRYHIDVRKEAGMTLLEQIQKRLLKLSPEKQREVLDFVAFLQLHSRKLPEPTKNTKQSKRMKDLLINCQQRRRFQILLILWIGKERYVRIELCLGVQHDPC